MNKSNFYIFIYSTVMVALVAAILSLTATVLKPYQEKNEEIAKKLDILHSVDKAWDADKAESKNDYVEAEYDKYITESFAVNMEGEVVEGVNAFELNLEKELEKDPGNRALPVFVSLQDDGTKSYIFPLLGKGLWGPIWGYLALDEDLNTISGVVFDHKSETPGLGAEINTREFQQQFIGKKLFSEQAFVSIAVVKQGIPLTDHAVNGISGGTITSKGLEAMVEDCMKNYVNLIKSLK